MSTRHVVDRPVCVDGWLTPEECRAIRTADGLEWKRSQVTNEVRGDAGRQIETLEAGRIRSTDESSLPEPWASTVEQRLSQAVRRANDEHFGFELARWGSSEGLAVLRYDVNRRGHFTLHRDVGPTFSTRKLSVSVQLSDGTDYVGGDLRFPFIPELAPREIGTMVVFPSYLAHDVTPVVEGERHALVAWIHGPAFR